MTAKSEGGHQMPAGAALGESRAAARATSYDVARLAGVSQSAVSRAFRDGASVSVKTRRKIEAAARELGYAPSQIARSLISQRSRMIAVIVTDLSSRAYPEILFYLGKEVQDTANRMLVFALPSDAESDSIVRDVLAYHVDGIISSAVLDDGFLLACDRQNVPVVLFNRTPLGLLGSSVSCDHQVGMGMLVREIAASNPGPIAFVAGPADAPVSRERMAGAVAALQQLGRPIDHVVYSDYSFEGGRAAARSLMTRSDRPRTILCANDLMALGVMDECRSGLSLSVPRDVAVTGFDDVPQAAWPSYELTTLRQPIRRMAHTAVRLLTEQIDGTTAAGERRLLPAELKLRGSTLRA
jgi:DNA-binding LacI/PurR family transcriptional regulator